MYSTAFEREEILHIGTCSSRVIRVSAMHSSKENPDRSKLAIRSRSMCTNHGSNVMATRTPSRQSADITPSFPSPHEFHPSRRTTHPSRSGEASKKSSPARADPLPIHPPRTTTPIDHAPLLHQRSPPRSPPPAHPHLLAHTDPRSLQSTGWQLPPRSIHRCSSMYGRGRQCSGSAVDYTGDTSLDAHAHRY
jgi:hypothetical protein